MADFYQHVFGCVSVPPERDPSGSIMEAGTGVPGAHLRGMHLRLPSYGAAGGRSVGEVVTVQIASGAQVTWCYVTDPEGNIIELQAWSA